MYILHSDDSATQPAASRDEIELALSAAHKETAQLTQELDKMEALNKGLLATLNGLALELEEMKKKSKSSDKKKFRTVLIDQLYSEYYVLLSHLCYMFCMRILCMYV